MGEREGREGMALGIHSNALWPSPPDHRRRTVESCSPRAHKVVAWGHTHTHTLAPALKKI